MLEQEQTQNELQREKFNQWVKDNLPQGFIANDGERSVAWAMYQKLRPVIPAVGTHESEKAIEAMLELYDWPTNPQANARCGWEAARNFK